MQGLKSMIWLVNIAPHLEAVGSICDQRIEQVVMEKIDPTLRKTNKVRVFLVIQQSSDPRAE